MYLSRAQCDTATHFMESGKSQADYWKRVTEIMKYKMAKDANAPAVPVKFKPKAELKHIFT